MNPESFLADREATPSIVTVAELNRLAGRLLERNFPLLWVAGEISNLSRASSGHWYFVLKDRDAQVRCVMFRSRNSLLDWSPENGDHVEARATVGLYAARGDFQLTVEHLRRAGAGVLYEAFLRLKRKLEAEGLFDPGRKRPLPTHARAIGVVTSLEAAALRDVLATLRRRARHVRVIVYPAPVQGREAPARLLLALESAARRAVTLSEIDVLLVVRGGGSIEDLAAFNDEALARAIAAFPVPVVTGIGHETDFTIADFVAHVRAPTPTAAAELASPDGVGLGQEVLAQRRRLAAAWERTVAVAAQRLDDAQRRLRSPAQRLLDSERRLEALAVRLSGAQANALAGWSHRVALGRLRLAQMKPAVGQRQAALARLVEQLVGRSGLRLGSAQNRLQMGAARLALLDPRGLLARGYAIVSDGNGRVVSDVAALAPGARIDIALARGTAVAQVLDLHAPKT